MSRTLIITAPYSYVVHDPRTQDCRLHTHTHVIFPGMTRDDVKGW